MSDPGSRPKLGWIIALSGMLVIPLGGLVWAAIAGGSSADSAETAATAADDDDGAAASGTKSTARKTSKTKKPVKKATPRSGRKVTHDAAACCAALRTAGQELAVDKRPTFLAAAAACESAPTAARAKSQIRSIVEGSRLELPSECAD